MRARFLLVTAFVGGCHLVGGTDGLYIEPASTSSEGGTGGTGGATTATTATTGGSDGTGGMGTGGFVCTNADQCKIPEDSCMAPKCTEGACEAIPIDSGWECDENGGSVCDGEGNCVECVVDEDCTGAACIDAFCASPSCEDGVQGVEETDVDCGGECPPCDNAGSCVSPGDCKSTICTQLVCTACTAHGQCGPDDYCEENSTGYCVPKKNAWSSCDENAQCKSGLCWFSSCFF